MGKWPLWKTNRRQESDSIEREDALLIAFSKQCFPFFKIRLIPLGKAYFTYVCEFHFIYMVELMQDKIYF